jgi:hypothetical protein
MALCIDPRDVTINNQNDICSLDAVIDSVPHTQ